MPESFMKDSEAKPYNIFVVNPGSTSTKLAVFSDESQVFSASINHDAAEFKKHSSVAEQLDVRCAAAQVFLKEHNVSSVSAIAARGGLLRPVQGGVYKVNQHMLEELSAARHGEHASNLGALIASKIAPAFGCESFIVDPVVVDEMEPVARISGMPEIERKSIFHALNQKSAARKVAAQLGKKYQDCNFIVAHLGGGISVGAHCRGRVIDVNNALGGEGPFSPERSGGLPSLQLAVLLERNESPISEIKKRIVGQGGLCAYCGTTDLRQINALIKEGDKHAELVVEALSLIHI